MFWKLLDRPRDRTVKKRYRIVIAEDHTILREGLRSLLSSNPDLEIVGEAEDGRDAIRCVEKLKPDLVLMDLSMPKMDGLDAITEIKKQRRTPCHQSAKSMPEKMVSRP